VTVSVDDLVIRARRRIHRVGPYELESVMADGGIVVDIRPAGQRREEGPLPGAVIVERNELEWRLDPTSAHRIPDVRDHHQAIVVVCSEGYASTLAAASLVDLGHERVADLVGGFLAWRKWFEHPATPRADTRESSPAGR
jgi:rhodanese-related sulfurtransferase